MVAEREIPARQCTMTLQFETLALSVEEGQTDRYEYASLPQRLWRQSASTEDKLAFPGTVWCVIRMTV